MSFDFFGATAPMPNALKRFFDGGPPLMVAPTKRASSTSAMLSATRQRQLNAESKRVYVPPSSAEPVMNQPITHAAPSLVMPQIMKRVNDIRAGVPVGNELSETLQCGKNQVVNLEAEKFEFFQVKKPNIKQVDLPCEGGYFAQPSLVPPAARKQALFIETSKQSAEKELRKQLHAQMRMGALMQMRHPNGVLGVENPGNAESIVYASQHQQLTNERTRIANKEERSRERHRASTSIATLLTDYNRDNEHVKLFMTKRKNKPPENNHARLFLGEGDMDMKHEPFVLRPPKAERMQHLRDMETNGRKMNIITGAAYDYLPPAMEERVNFRQTHYSLNPPPTPSHVRK